jgi:hypothetical protein
MGMHPRVLMMVGACTLCAWAAQEGFARLGLEREVFEKRIGDYVKENAATDGLRVPGAGAAGKALLALDDGARAAVVREAGTIAKAFIMSPAFETSYNDYIRNRYRAVNHGMKVVDTQNQMEESLKKGDFAAYEAASRNMQRDMHRQTVVERLASFATMEPAAFEVMADVDAGLMDVTDPQTPAGKAAITKAKGMLAEAKKLAGSDLPKARETYKAAMLLSAGFASEAEAVEARQEKQRREEQINFNRVQLKPVLKRRLTDFAAVVKTVDFSAATTLRANRHVFVNPAHERKDEMWKLLYRLGPGGANAAAQIAQAWAAEL